MKHIYTSWQQQGLKWPWPWTSDLPSNRGNWILTAYQVWSWVKEISSCRLQVSGSRSPLGFVPTMGIGVSQTHLVQKLLILKRWGIYTIHFLFLVFYVGIKMHELDDTVKPVYSGQQREYKNMAFIHRRPLYWGWTNMEALGSWHTSKSQRIWFLINTLCLILNS